MLKVLKPGAVTVTCYLDPSRRGDSDAKKIAKEQGVAYRSIQIGGEPTSCVNYEDKNGKPRIDCNYDSIVNQSNLQDPNYVLSHHEYASIAKIEARHQDSHPDFSVSNQLSQYEEWVRVKKLGKRKSAASASSVVRGLVSIIGQQKFKCELFYQAQSPENPVWYQFYYADETALYFKGRDRWEAAYYGNVVLNDRFTDIRVRPGQQPRLTISDAYGGDFYRNNLKIIPGDSAVEGNFLVSAEIYTSEDEKKVEKIVFYTQKYVNVGTVTSPAVGLDAVNERTICTAL